MKFSLIKQYFFTVILVWYARLLLKTVKIKLHDENNFFDHSNTNTCIFLFWHNHVFAVVLAFLHYYYKKRPHNKGVKILVSKSRDGDLVTKIVSFFKIYTIRGSSSKGSFRSLKNLMYALNNGYDVAITPDGPRGPKYSFKSSSIFLAQKTGCPIICFSANYYRTLKLNTWDRFCIPLPFSKIDVYLKVYGSIDPTKDVDIEAKAVQDFMKKNTI